MNKMADARERFYSVRVRTAGAWAHAHASVATCVGVWPWPRNKSPISAITPGRDKCRRCAHHT